MLNNLKSILSNKHFKQGAPFLVLVVAGSFGLKYYAQLKYDIQHERHVMTKTKELQKMIGYTKENTIEEEYEEIKKKVDIDDWKNIRGPRPWEDDNKEYKEQMERITEDSKNRWVFSK